MKILVLTHAEVDALLPMGECIEVEARALAMLAAQHVYGQARESGAGTWVEF